METKEQIAREILAKIPYATKEQLDIIRGAVMGLDISGWFSPKHEMIYEAAVLLSQLYFEDCDFICGFIAQFAQKKGIKKAAPDAANIQSGKVESV